MSACFRIMVSLQPYRNRSAIKLALAAQVRTPNSKQPTYLIFTVIITDSLSHPAVLPSRPAHQNQRTVRDSYRAPVDRPLRCLVRAFQAPRASRAEPCCHRREISSRPPQSSSRVPMLERVCEFGETSPPAIVRPLPANAPASARQNTAKALEPATHPAAPLFSGCPPACPRRLGRHGCAPAFRA